MHIKLKKIIISALPALMFISMAYNVYSHYKLNTYKSNLSSEISLDIYNIASGKHNLDDQKSFAILYADIDSALDSYRILNENIIPPIEEGEANLSEVLTGIRTLMLHDKEKFDKLFSDVETLSLLFEISEDFENQEAIDEFVTLLK